MNLTDKISKYFTLNEATYLPKWKTNHILSNEELSDIKHLAAIMDKVRELIGKPCSVHVWMRPESLNNPQSEHHGESYNKLVGGAPKSMHRFGRAVDCHFEGISCADAKKIILPKLAELGLRMEDNGENAQWIHLDTRNPGPGGRFFKP